MRMVLLVALVILLNVGEAVAAVVCTSSVTGQYVSQRYARRHPDITTCADSATAVKRQQRRQQQRQQRQQPE